MVTTVTSTISNTVAADYSTLQAWEDAAPVDLVAADIIWKGEIIAADTFSTGSSTALTLSGSTTDSTRYKELTVADGFSIFDNGDNPLRYDASKGAAIATTTGAPIAFSENYSRVSRLQFFSTTATNQIPVFSGVTGVQLNRIISETSGNNAALEGISTVISNTLFIQRKSAASLLIGTNVSGATTDLINCTFVVASDITAATSTMFTASGTTINSTNCAFMNTCSSSVGTGSGTRNFTTCAANLASPPTGVTNVSFANAKFAKGDNTRSDFRIKGNSSLKNAGTTSATYASTDIFGVSRPVGASYDIGCHESSAVITNERTISLSGTPDYSTLQAWEDAAETDLTASNEIWKGVIQQASDKFTERLVVGGSTVDATRYKELTAKVGASFIDHADVLTNPLRLDFSKGCGIERIGTDHCILISENFFRFSRLQLSNSNASRATALVSSTGISGARADQCIFEDDTSTIQLVSWPGNNGASLTNCVFIHRVSSASSIILTAEAVTITNCTLVVPSDKTAATLGINATGTLMPTLTNCAIFGAASVSNASFTATTCYTDVASPPTGFKQVAYNTTTGSGFENITDATRDFRIKSTSALVDAGSNTTQTAVDIIGKARPIGATYDVGAFEFGVEGSKGPFGQNKMLLLGVG